MGRRGNQGGVRRLKLLYTLGVKLRISILFFALGLALCAQQKPVIGVAGISHESNSFNVNNASLEDFGGVTPQPTEAEFIAEYENSNSTVSGYVNCKTCHSLDGTRILGPTFQGRWGLPSSTSAGPVIFDEAYVIESTREPNAKVVDSFPPVMPAMALTDEHLEAIIAFLKTL